MTRFSAEETLKGLKDFQRRTAEYVFSRMYDEQDPAHRFLVADEVGLGKTLVTRGVIAQVVEHLQDNVDRIDIVYVCSNGQIARQNLNRLRIGVENDLELVERITMLPTCAGDLDKVRSSLRRSDSGLRVNLISFTPGTSFDLHGGSGKSTERAVIRMMLTLVWTDLPWRSAASYRLFQGGVQDLDRFTSTAKEMRNEHRSSVPTSIVQSLQAELDAEDARRKRDGRASVKETYLDLQKTFQYEQDHWRVRRERNEFIGCVRHLLARACLASLEPDLIVLDEFQRFRHLLEAPPVEEDESSSNGGANLARELFNYVDTEANQHARVLLLSATPYKMMTTDLDSEDDHHRDLVTTASFLMEHDKAREAEFSQALGDLRRAMLQIGRDSGASARAARARVEASLRRVMVRTERLAATPNRSGMLGAPRDGGVALKPEDVLRYVAIARASRSLHVGDPIEYWKSTPYLANFQGGYQLGKALAAPPPDASPELAADLEKAGLLDFDAIENFDRLDPGHPRLQWLIDDVVSNGAWRLLWMPPSLPYLQPSGPYADPEIQRFTKRLIFSSWTMVPRVISTLVTYAAEREIVSAQTGKPAYRNTAESRAPRARLLEFSKSDERLTGMPVFGILYPSFALAELGDPLSRARAAGGDPPSRDEAVAAVSQAIRAELEAVRSQMASMGMAVPDTGPADERWYWAGPLWLDWIRDRPASDGLAGLPIRQLEAVFLATQPTGEESGRLREHLVEAQNLYLHNDELGRMPEDLEVVLAIMALGAPGPVALRALTRVSGNSLTELVDRRAACSVAWALRSLFNGSEATELVRSQTTGDRYWQRVLEYSIAGNLQAVLDEFAAVLLPAGGHQDPGAATTVDAIAESMRNVVALRTVNYGVTRVDVDEGRITTRPANLRANFALRLGAEASEGGMLRESDVRDAFNSPFWPFVLATTSAGQEGLDFHHYCHAVVHWNLPGNPVDLEQREGRVHRFMGHAVRRNVALRHGSLGRRSKGNPWTDLFARAEGDRADGENEIQPWWIYVAENGSVIERYVPALPLSRDRARAAQLRRAVGLYRLAFGQPRQDELLAYLGSTVDSELLDRLANDLRIDLTPPEPAGRDAKS